MTSWRRSIARIQLADSRLLYLSPVKAQIKEMKTHFAALGWSTWEAATVHSQQGAEADTVILDTVNASSVGWPVDDWMRLINVALSRARHQLILPANLLRSTTKPCRLPSSKSMGAR